MECAENNDSEVSSTSTEHGDDRVKMSRNHLTAEIFSMEDPRLKRLSR